MKIYLDQELRKRLASNEEELSQLGYVFQDEADQETQVIVSNNKELINSPELYPALQYTHLTSAGFDDIDLSSIKQQQILVSNARGVYSEAIAEFVVARLLEVVHCFRQINQSQREYHWNKDVNPLSLKKMHGAILGTGSIGKETARLLNGFGTICEGFNTKGTAHPEFNDCYPLSEFDQRADQYDFVVITLPLNDQTKHYFNKERLLLLNKEAILVNIARGQIIKEEDLIDILDSHLKAVILDVFEEEPLNQKSPLWTNEKAYLSPHISFKDNFYKDNFKKLIVNNLKRFILNEEVLNQIY